jgi:hypothetical protein
MVCTEVWWNEPVIRECYQNVEITSEMSTEGLRLDWRHSETQCLLPISIFVRDLLLQVGYSFWYVLRPVTGSKLHTSVTLRGPGPAFV